MLSPRKSLTLCGLALLLAACTALQTDLPAITESPTDNRDTGRVVWHDLLTNTPDASRRFYSKLFGWQFEDSGTEAYQLIRHEGKLIGGMADTRALGHEANVSQWVTVISVANMEAAVVAVKNGGGKVLTPPTHLPSRGTLAVIEDPEGAFFALLQTTAGDPPEAEPVLNGFLWDEVWAREIDNTRRFYQSVFAYELDSTATAEGDYGVFSTSSMPRLGLLPHPFPEVRPVMANYLWVEDPAAITQKVEALGGEILLEAGPRPLGGTVALIAGPSGAGIALQTWPLPETGDL